jgi:hypothetical protein
MTHEEAKKRWDSARGELNTYRRSRDWLPSTAKILEDECLYWYGVMKKLEKKEE